jgi:hypothetical protein
MCKNVERNLSEWGLVLSCHANTCLWVEARGLLLLSMPFECQAVNTYSHTVRVPAPSHPTGSRLPQSPQPGQCWDPDFRSCVMRASPFPSLCHLPECKVKWGSRGEGLLIQSLSPGLAENLVTFSEEVILTAPRPEVGVPHSACPTSPGFGARTALIPTALPSQGRRQSSRVWFGPTETGKRVWDSLALLPWNSWSHQAWVPCSLPWPARSHLGHRQEEDSTKCHRGNVECLPSPLFELRPRRYRGT